MSSIGQPERATQNRVIALFRHELRYRYLGDWTDRDTNSNIEEKLLTAYLTQCGYTQAQINVAIHKLRIEADNHSRGLYGNNQAVYNLLRYGVPAKIEAGKVTETVQLINWQEPKTAHKCPFLPAVSRKHSRRLPGRRQSSTDGITRPRSMLDAGVVPFA